MNTWKIILATLVIFGAGLVTGRLLTLSVAPNPSFIQSTLPASPQVDGSRDNARENKISAPMPGPLRKEFVDRLDQVLQLTPKQRARVEKVICDGQEQTRSIWHEVEPEMHKSFAETKERIRKELTPEQQKLFGELLKQRSRNPQSDKSTNSPSSTINDGAELDLEQAFCLLLGWKSSPASSCNSTNSTARCL